jgi:hypothetical protein
VYPPWETALAYRAQLQPGVALALLREPGRDTGPVTAGRWQAFPATRGSAYGRLLDDVLARPWAWPPHAAPLLFTLSGVRPPASPTPIMLAALPRAGAGAVVAALAALACGRLAGEHVTAPLATAALVAGVAVAGASIARRLRQWQTAVAARLATAPGTALEAAAVPLRREHVLGVLLGVERRWIEGVPTGRHVLDDALRRACTRAGVPELEITHLLRVLAARHALGGAKASAVVPEQAFPLDQREPSG